MEHPVVAPSGHTYDRSAILAWLERRPVDPLSGTPLSAVALYPNRALQDEITSQLEALASQAASCSHAALAEAARAKLAERRAAVSAGMPTPSRWLSREGAHLDWLIGRCAACAVWCGELCREQVLVCFTSLGALLCFALDAREAGKRAAGGGRALDGGPPRQLLSTFIKLAVAPALAPPRDWQVVSRSCLTGLRCMLLMPFAPTCLALAMGGALSVARFARQFLEVRALELERAGQNRWWIWARDFGGAITGITSFGLFVRLFLDSQADARRL